MIDRRHMLGTSALGLAGLMAGCAVPPLPRPGTADPAGGADLTANTGTSTGRPMPTPLIANLHERSFYYFWDTTDPATGLTPDRGPTPSFASIAAVGFALTAYPIGVENGWITRDQARTRTLTTLQFFAAAPQGDSQNDDSGFHGLFYHFLGTTKGHRFARAELSTVDTALLMGGVLFSQSWFDSDHPDEVRIRALAEQLYAAVDWAWIVPRPPFMAMGWHPESGFIPHDWNIYNEAMLLYILAIGSPTHALPPQTWDAWTSRFGAQWTDRWGGEPYIHFGPMFVHQYSHCWIDFRDIRDRYIATKGIDYFENSCRAVRAQRAYAIANPGGWTGYGADVWGLTASDGPGDFTATIGGRKREFFSYSARGPGDRDDGTIAPTAAAASFAFEPELSRQAIEAMHERYGANIYGKYGFLDAFNPTLTATKQPLKHGRIIPGAGWVDDDYIGIDQGPIVVMMENWRTGLVWKTMKRNPHIRRGLQRAGFTGGWLA
ncbi:glucoamylase family protein [Sphingomonas faeni]|uniref:glucoamylase family protein n=1 Tax=Sphingomonas faeni TaxID=185950 RepID=UPI0020BE4F30|nr:glucoamylase family protein [Sphingomonas faeni]MCK8455624.1 Tat pathway signal protein [Sphingomonas faeni]